MLVRALSLVLLLGAVGPARPQAYATHHVGGLAGAKLGDVLKARAVIAPQLPGRLVRIALIERQRTLLWSAQGFDAQGVLRGLDLFAKDGKVDRRYAMSKVAAENYPSVRPKVKLERAVQVATKNRAGTVIEVRLDKFGKKPVWSVHLVDSKAQRWGVLVDASTGSIVTGR